MVVKNSSWYDFYSANQSSSGSSAQVAQLWRSATDGYLIAIQYTYTIYLLTNINIKIQELSSIANYIADFCRHIKFIATDGRMGGNSRRSDHFGNEKIIFILGIETCRFCLQTIHSAVVCLLIVYMPPLSFRLVSMGWEWLIGTELYKIIKKTQANNLD